MKERGCIRVFKTLAFFAVDWICPLSLMGTTCSSSLTSCCSFPISSPSIRLLCRTLLSLCEAQTLSLIFSFYCKLCVCVVRVGGILVSHMAAPEASGADVLGIGTLLCQAHAYLLSHTPTHGNTRRGLKEVCYRGKGH